MKFELIRNSILISRIFIEVKNEIMIEFGVGLRIKILCKPMQGLKILHICQHWFPFMSSCI